MNDLIILMETNPVDSIAQYALPDGHPDRFYWWIAVAILGICGIAWFVVKHYFRGKLLDPKPRPLLTVRDGNRLAKKITFPKSTQVDIEAEVSKQVSQQMTVLKEKYRLHELDPYKNMNLIFQSNFNAAANWNADVQSYLEGMEEYYQHIIRDRVMSSCYKPVELVLQAKGRKTCTNLHLEIEIDGDLSHLIAGDSRTQKEAIHDVAPEKEEADRSDSIYAMFPNDQEKYSYYEWNLVPACQTARIQYDKLISGSLGEAIAITFYIDSRYQQELTIRWRINGDDIKDAGVKGEIEAGVI